MSVEVRVREVGHRAVDRRLLVAAEPAVGRREGREVDAGQQRLVARSGS